MSQARSPAIDSGQCPLLGQCELCLGVLMQLWSESGLGQNLALIEMKLVTVLCCLLQQFDFKIVLLPVPTSLPRPFFDDLPVSTFTYLHVVTKMTPQSFRIA